MGRTCSLTEWAHFIKTTHKASMSYWWVYCRHCVIAAMNASPDAAAVGSTHLGNSKSLQEFIDKLPPPSSAAASAAAPSPTTLVSLDGAFTAAPPSSNGGGTSSTTTTDHMTSATSLHALVGRRSVMKAHLSQCVHASPIPPNPIVKRRAGKRGVHCAIAEWAHFHRLDKEGYIGNTNYFPVVCKYCSDAYDAKKRPVPPEVFAGRKESMRRHLTSCDYFTGHLPAKKKKGQDGGAKSLSEWEFFHQLDRQPGSMYHFAKCKLCTEAHERNPSEMPPPKTLLGRKHNMQTHLANCQHMLNLHGDVMDDIVFSSDDDDGGDMQFGDDLQQSGLVLTSPSSSSSTATTDQALVLFTIEYGLPFSWVDSTHMHALVPGRPALPSAVELSTTILRRVQRAMEASHRHCLTTTAATRRWTLVVDALAFAQDVVTCVAWLVHPPDRTTTNHKRLVVPQWLPGQTSLTWRCATADLAAAVDARVRFETSLVGLLLPLPLPSLAAQHPHLYCRTSVLSLFHAILQCVLQDDMVTRVLRTALKLAPLPSTLLWTNWGAWLALVAHQRPHYPLELDFWHQLDSVGAVLASLSLAHRRARANTLSAAHTLHALGRVHRQSQALNRTTLLQLKLERELETRWFSMEQPLFVLAYALHPTLRPALRRRRTKFTPDELGHVACQYYARWFEEAAPHLAADVAAYVDENDRGAPRGSIDDADSGEDNDDAAREAVRALEQSHPQLARLMTRLLDIVPSFCLDGQQLPSHQYSMEEWQHIKYIAHCTDIAPKETEDIHDVDALLLKWRSQEPVDAALGGLNDDGQSKVPLHELFGAT
ncbi:Aste57867_21589 [Aphanomyces stellatus]|uniref:Aste57867_21589 protein n=1 Tax=Aphanomyces stellatus TaxID=120398 RepID=A0A485LIJ8_9STRA|nr:hypothetical protein As57867_021520 [Aphanomyces stellatus]VFT98259.1 Aste57867_21589 [Aphanomyces stellatus]